MDISDFPFAVQSKQQSNPILGLSDRVYLRVKAYAHKHHIDINDRDSFIYFIQGKTRQDFLNNKGFGIKTLKCLIKWLEQQPEIQKADNGTY